MILKNLSDVFPNEELIQISNINEKGVTEEECIVMEYYCAKPDCDCRKVRFVVMSKTGKQYVFDYGWESFEFYKKWMYGDEKMAKELVGLSPDSWTVQPDDIEDITNVLQKIIDKSYISKRIQNRYEMMKDDNFDEDKEFELLDKKINNNKKIELEKKKQKERNKKKLAKKQKQKNRK